MCNIYLTGLVLLAEVTIRTGRDNLQYHIRHSCCVQVKCALLADILGRNVQFLLTLAQVKLLLLIDKLVLELDLHIEVYR